MDSKAILMHSVPQTFQSMINEVRKYTAVTLKSIQTLPYCISKPNCRHDFIYTPFLQPSGEQNCCCQISTIGLTLLMCGRVCGLWDQCYPWRAAWLYGIYAAHRATANSQRNAWIPLVLTLKEEHSLRKSVGDGIIRMTNSH